MSPWPFVLTFGDITQQLRLTFEGFIDQRPGQNTWSRLIDAGLRAFSIFFMQSPWLLEY